MMGASVPPSGEFGSFYQMLALLKDHDEYTKKLQDLEQRVNTAQHTLEQATKNNREAEENRKLAQEMFTTANMKVEDANRRVGEATKLVDGVSNKERELQAREIALETKRAEMLAEFADKRDALDQAKKHQQAEFDHMAANFEMEARKRADDLQTKNQELLGKEAAVNRREDELKKLLAENNDTRDLLQAKMRELDEKLAKLKAIAGA